MVYMAINRLNKEQDERILVLAIDVDNDLYRKTKISGPLIGKVQNLNGATQLALADPEETDANTMFEAVKIYDELKEKGYIVNVATVTGTETEGYDSDREVARQIDLILERNHSDVCILVTDGASDNRVIPIIQSRIKINSVKYVRMKQSEAFESAYFTVLEKLKEPHYARIVFGIPAVLILAWP
jgi:Predicted membrane protein